MMKGIAVLSCLLNLCLLSPVLVAEELSSSQAVRLENPTFSGGATGWKLDKCRFVPKAEAGKDSVAIPGWPADAYSELSQKILLPQNLSSLCIRVGYKSSKLDASGFKNKKSWEPKICITYSDDNGNALWPKGKDGLGSKLAQSFEWTTQSFELERPEGATIAKISIDAFSPRTAALINEISLEAKSKTPELGDLRKKQAKTEVPSNALLGLSTGFKVGGAGWQHYAIPYWPATPIPFEWGAPPVGGEGHKSLVLRPGYGIQSFPFSLKADTPYTISFIAKSTIPQRNVTLAAMTNKPKWMTWWFGKELSVDEQWRRLSFSVRTPVNMSSGASLMFENKDKGGDGNILISAICVAERDIKDYIAPPYEMSLSTGVFGNYAFSKDAPLKIKAKYFPHDGRGPEKETWIWSIKDVTANDKKLNEESATWTGTSNGIYEAEIEIPHEQGLYRVLLVERGQTDFGPMNEILAARIGFEGLPEVGANPKDSFLGVHFQNQLVACEKPPYYKEMIPESELERRFALYRQCGVRWVRELSGRVAPFGMSAVMRSESEPAFFCKREQELMKKAGLEPFGVLEPALDHKYNGWIQKRMSKGGDWAQANLPTDLNLWNRYIYSTVSEYKGLVDCWEIWNEPNGTMKSSEYLPFLSTAIKAAKAANPRSYVTGICASSDFSANIDNFFGSCLKVKDSTELDAITIHPYTSGAPTVGLYQGAVKLRDQLVPGKELWGSESGWETFSSYDSLRARVKNQVEHPITPIRGAAYVVRNMILAKRFGLTKYFTYAGEAIATFRPWEWSPFFDCDGTPSSIFIFSGVATRLVGQAKFMDEVKLDQNLKAYIFIEKPGSVLAVLWNELKNDNACYSLHLDLNPDEAWDAAGRKILAVENGFQIGIAPTYLRWRIKSANEVEEALSRANFNLAQNRSLRGTIFPDALPEMAIVAMNISELPMRLKWTANGEKTDVIDVPTGKASVIAHAKLPIPQDNPVSGELWFDGYTKGVSIFNSYIDLNLPELERKVVDGNLDDWKEVAWTSLKLVDVSKKFDAKDSQPPIFSISSDKKGLSIAVKAFKSKCDYCQTKLGISQLQMDSIEVYLRRDATHVDWLDGEFQPGDIKLSVAQSTANPTEKHLNIDISKMEDFDAEQVEYAFSHLPAPLLGFQCEIKIPWSAIHLPEKTELLGLDIGVNISENGEDRTFQYMWSGTAENWHNTCHWGVVNVQPK